MFSFLLQDLKSPGGSAKFSFNLFFSLSISIFYIIHVDIYKKINWNEKQKLKENFTHPVLESSGTINKRWVAFLVVDTNKWYGHLSWNRYQQLNALKRWLFSFFLFLHNIRSVQNNTSIHTTTVCFHGWCYNKNWLDKLIRKSHIGQGWLYIIMTSYLFFFLFTHSRFVEIQEQDIVFFLQFLKVGVLMVLV